MNHMSSPTEMIAAKAAQPPATISTEGVDLDFGGAMAALKRNRLLILAIIILALGAAVLVTLRSPRLYRATATVQIEQQTAKVLSSDEEQPAVSQEADRFLQTQISILNSRAMAKLVAGQLKLVSPRIPAIAALPPQQRETAVINLLQAGLSITLPRDSRIAQITFASSDPVLAAQVANAYADNSIVYNLQRRFDESSYARTFLQRELDQAKTRLGDSEKAVVAYSRQNRLVDAAGGGGAAGEGIRVLTSSSMIDVNGALSRAQVAKTDAEQRWNMAAKASPLSLPEVISNPVIVQLSQQRAQILAVYDKERQSHSPDYPSMREANAQIASLDRQITIIADFVRTGLRNGYQIAVAEEQALRAKLESLKTATLDEQDRSIQYYILRREVDSNRQMYDGLLQRFKEVSAAAGVAANNLSVVDRAEVPRQPFSPAWRLNLASGMIAGLVLALLAVAIRSRLDNTIRNPEDIRSSGLHLLGTVPKAPAKAQLAEALEDPAVAEAFWSLRTTLDNALSDFSAHSIMLTSPRASAGKSSVAFAIARNFAQSGRRTILVDGDLRKPSLHGLAAVQDAEGFGDVLAGRAHADHLLQSTSWPNLRILTVGSRTANSPELLAGPHLASAMKRLHEACDILIVDSCPVLGFADAALLAKNVGMAIFVVEANATSSIDMTAAMQRFSVSGVGVSGAILTKYNETLHLYQY